MEYIVFLGTVAFCYFRMMKHAQGQRSLFENLLSIQTFNTHPFQGSMPPQASLYRSAVYGYYIQVTSKVFMIQCLMLVERYSTKKSGQVVC